MELAKSWRGRAAAGAVALAVLAGLGGCRGGGAGDTPFTPPGRGQAAILLTADQTGSGLDLNEIRDDDALSFGPDGSLYLLRTDVFKVSPKRKVSRVWRAGTYQTGGLVALPDGSLAVGVKGAVLRISPHGSASTLAGVPAAPAGKDGKGATADRSGAGGRTGTPGTTGDGSAATGDDGTAGDGGAAGNGGAAGGGSTADDGTAGDGSAAGNEGAAGNGSAAGGGSTAGEGSAAAHRFAGVARPLGVRPDGALLVSDADGIWAVQDGAVTAVWAAHRPYADQADRSSGASASTATAAPTTDGAGDAYVLPSGTAPPGGIGDVIRITPGGTAAKLPEPRSITGLGFDPARLHIQWMTGDGADGLYVNAYDDEDSRTDVYVLHVRDGGTQILAHYPSLTYTFDCTMRHPVNALKLPCSLPIGMAYRPGALVMDGRVHYMLELALP